MFDLMTDQELAQLIDQLRTDRDAVFAQMMDGNWQARISVFSDEWAILSARHMDITDVHIAAITEQSRRADLADELARLRGKLAGNA